MIAVRQRQNASGARTSALEGKGAGVPSTRGENAGITTQLAGSCPRAPPAAAVGSTGRPYVLAAAAVRTAAIVINAVAGARLRRSP